MNLDKILETKIKNPDAYGNINRVWFTGKQVKELIQLAINEHDKERAELMKKPWVLYLKQIYSIDPIDINREENDPEMNIQEVERIAEKLDLDQSDILNPSQKIDFCKKYNFDFYKD